MRQQAVIQFKIRARVLSSSRASRRKERVLPCELCGPYSGLDIPGIRLGLGISRKCVDYRPCMATEHSLGIGLLPGPDRSTRVHCRTLEGIEGRLLSTNSGARADDSCSFHRRARFLDLTSRNSRSRAGMLLSGLRQLPRLTTWKYASSPRRNRA